MTVVEFFPTPPVPQPEPDMSIDFDKIVSDYVSKFVLGQIKGETPEEAALIQQLIDVGTKLAHVELEKHVLSKLIAKFPQIGAIVNAGK